MSNLFSVHRRKHRNYLDFVFSTIGDKAVVRLLEQPYDEKKVRGVLDDACKDWKQYNPASEDG